MEKKQLRVAGSKWEERCSHIEVTKLCIEAKKEDWTWQFRKREGLEEAEGKAANYAASGDDEMIYGSHRTEESVDNEEERNS